MSGRERRNSDSQIYLPSDRGVYVNTTTDRKPAFGRKKKDRLLEDFGFDILGQAFGIPSRVDFERGIKREVRRHGAFTTQSTMPPITPRERSTKHHGLYKGGGYSISVNRNLLRSSPASALTRIHRGAGSLSSCASHNKVSEARDANLTPNNLYPPGAPIPALYPTWDIGNRVATSPYHNLPVTPVARPPGYTIQLPTSGNFPQPHAVMVPSLHYIQPPSRFIPQTASPLFFHRSQAMAPRQEVRSPIYPMAGFFMTAPPPSLPVATPLSTNQQRDGLGSATLNNSLPISYSPSEAKKCEKHYNEVRKATILRADKDKEVRRARRDVGKHIQHIHFCAGCGRVRSKKYQKGHPLRRGQVPDRDYCNKCQREAALVGGDGTNDSEIDRANENPAPTTLANMSCIRCSEKRDGKKVCKACKRKKSRQFSSSSIILTDITTAEAHTGPPPSVSSICEPDTAVLTSARGSNPSVRETTHGVGSDIPLLSPGVPSGNREAIMRNYGYINNSSMADNVEGVNPEEMQSTPGLGDPGDTYVKGTCVSSGFRPSGNRPNSSHRRSPDAFSIAKPNTSLQSVSDHPKVASQCCNSPDKMNTPAGECRYRPANISEIRTPKAAGFDDHYSGFRDNQSIKKACGSICKFKLSCEGTRNARVHESRAHVNAELKQEKPASSLVIAHREHSGRRRVRRPQDDVGTLRHGLEGRHMDDGIEPETSCDSDYVFGWDLPPTPADSLYSCKNTSPYFVGESWNANQEGKEAFGQEFELLAEEDLMLAAKFFDDMMSPICNSGTSLFPMPSFVTRTEISIESYCSHKEPGRSKLSTATYELCETSEFDSTVDEGESRTGSLEFSGKADQDKGAGQIGSGASWACLHGQSPGEKRSESSLKQCGRNIYCPDELVPRSSLGFSPLNPASSMIVHTGHSLEGVRLDLSEHTDLAVASKRGRIRQLLGL